MPCTALMEANEQQCRPVFQRTILVIDDDRHFRSLVGAHLSRAGYDALEAENGAEGMRLLARLSQI